MAETKLTPDALRMEDLLEGDACEAYARAWDRQQIEAAWLLERAEPGEVWDADDDAEEKQMRRGWMDRRDRFLAEL